MHVCAFKLTSKHRIYMTLYICTQWYDHTTMLCVSKVHDLLWCWLMYYVVNTLTTLCVRVTYHKLWCSDLFNCNWIFLVDHTKSWCLWAFLVALSIVCWELCIVGGHHATIIICLQKYFFHINCLCYVLSRKPDPLNKAYKVTERARTDVEQGQVAIEAFVVKFNPTRRKDDYLHNVCYKSMTKWLVFHEFPLVIITVVLVLFLIVRLVY